MHRKRRRLEEEEEEEEEGREGSFFGNLTRMELMGWVRRGEGGREGGRER